jgi:chemosensory pili system protein ChpA (sensor histidine kinase/response regulator)
VRGHISEYSATPEVPDVLLACPDQLHQVSGALRIVGLAGATRFCEAIESAFAGANRGNAGVEELGVVDRAVVALRDFVDDLAQGQANVPLKLYPTYRELAALHGTPDASEKDLFFPDLTLQAPVHDSPRVLSPDGFTPFLEWQCVRFQGGFLAWLGQQPGGLHEMRQALDALHQVAPQLPEPQAVWWVAVGVVDGLLLAADENWEILAKAVCHKLDFHMREVAAGSQKANDPLLRELLYVLAKCKPVTPRVKDVKQVFQLDSLFPEPVQPDWEYDMDMLQPALIDMRSRLEALKDVWQQYISGERDSAEQFRELIASFNAKALELGNWYLIRLLDVIALVSRRLPDPYPQQGQFMIIEMASAFLLVESVIAHFTNPPADLESHTVIMGGWLLDAAKGKSTGKPPPGLRADLTQKIGVLQLRAQVAREILANLQHVEQVLDAFARDITKRDTLPPLMPHIRQIHGALVILDFDLAMALTSVCSQMIAECARSEHKGTAGDLDWIAEGLSTLELYLDPCVHGREPSSEVITQFFSRLRRRHEQQVMGAAVAAQPEARGADPLAPAPAREAETALPELAAPAAEPAPEAAAPAPAVETAAAPEPLDVDALELVIDESELLAIFLEEAGMLLAEIDGALQELRGSPEDRDALYTIRRAFHTLKGSGRMVELTEFTEVAWEIEQVLNRRLEQKRPATPELIELINWASAAFSSWIAQLRARRPLTIDAEQLVELARQLRTEEESLEAPADSAAAEAAAPVPEDEPPAAAVPESAPDPEEVAIGAVRLKRDFLEIYLREATQHVAALDAECTRWRSAPPGEDVAHEFLRAAHTLASSSRTAGFIEIAELASAVEQWIPVARYSTQQADVDTVRAAIARLRDMVTLVSLRQPPGPAEDAVRGLRALTARLKDAPPPPVEAKSPARGRERRAMRDDFDENLLPIFLQEAQELLPVIGNDLREWKANPGNKAISQALRRDLHTLKGSARMAGAIRLGELTHIMESRTETVAQPGQSPAELFEELEAKLDRLSLDLERMLERRAEPAPAAPAAAPAHDVPAQPSRVEPPPAPLVAGTLRISTDTLDRLINESGEISIARSRVEAALRVMKQSLGDLSDSIGRLRAQLREVEVQADSQVQSRLSVPDERTRDFDPLEFDRYTRLQEVTRMMVESLQDATSIQQTMLRNIGESDAAVLAQTRISRDVQQALMRMRAVPFSNLNERLYRVVRQSARELDKQAELDVEGGQVELDRSVLDRIGAPLEHMLRNAVAHGLESPAARAAAGKPETGRINIAVRQEANEIVLVLRDDGVGIDLAKLHRRALEMGVLGRDREMAEADLVQLVFVSGLSTAESITELSGRGVGMDVVRNEVSAIGGRVDIATARGRGTTFAVYLPLTLAVTQAVLVRAGTTVLAISSAMVEQVQRLKADAMVELYEKKTLEWQGRPYPLHYLQHLLGASGATEIQGYNSVLLLRSGIHRIALHVSELIGNHEIVVKNIGPQLARVPGVSGATVLADGRIALIVNPVQLAQRARVVPLREAPAPAVAKPAAPVVMVVDDSLTVRKVAGRLLEREGYQVLMAKDGVDALEQIKDTVPDVMLVDIEMPRMDGFDLARHVRGDPRTNRVPIIIISSRTAEKHRTRAEQLGVNVFLGKPFQEAALLAHVETLLGGKRTAQRYH